MPMNYLKNNNMSQQYDEEISDYFALNGAGLARDFGCPTAMHYVELYETCEEFQIYVKESFKEASDAWASTNPEEIRYN